MTVPTDPHAALAELEQAAIDGDPVTAAEMAAAIAAVDAAERISELAAQGERSREAEKAAAELASRQADLKAESTKELATLRTTADQRRQAALDALAALADACDEYVAAVNERAQRFHSAGILCAFWATSMDPRTDLPAVDGLDPDHYATFEQGMVVRELRTGGVTHVPGRYNAQAHIEDVAGEARTAYVRAQAARR